MTPVAIAVISYLGGALTMLVALAFGRAAKDPDIIVVYQKGQGPETYTDMVGWNRSVN